MRVFTCDSCGQLVFFDNSQCLRCDSPLGYIHDRRQIIALNEVGDDRFIDLGHPVRTWQRCATSELNGCNWLVPAGSNAMCESCALTRTRPADTDADGTQQLLSGEMAKRRLIFQLAELRLPVTRRDEATSTGLAFDLLSSASRKVVTGHGNGIITLDLAEAEPEHREHLRLQLSEPYRTLLGHFRHEIGHYYWPILVHRRDQIDACRALFGDDREDYSKAVELHYQNSDDDDESWKREHISRYASMHPYEDWAETFAHYLHILDTLQTAESFGLRTLSREGSPGSAERTGAHPTRPDGSTTFGDVINHWMELTYALNQIGRSMGHEDLYPFVLAAPVIRKMAFVDHLVQQQ
ncbi:MAG TPA: putative zinc-binding metallopeptidase [Acidimicrobiales bacterium]|jgi:hypothetical protein|nr:putative zinc-binding metallopeptidase [Acidimicrobiales bacterium]